MVVRRVAAGPAASHGYDVSHKLEGNVIVTSVLRYVRGGARGSFADDG